MSLDDFSPFLNITLTSGIDSIKQSDNQNHRSRKRNTNKPEKREPDHLELSTENHPNEIDEPIAENEEPLVDDSSISGAFIDIKI